MEEKFGDLVIQEIHMLGENMSKLDRKLDITLKQVYDEIKDNKKCNDKAHSAMHDKQNDHVQIHINEKHNYVGSAFFKWVIGFVIIGVFAIGSIVATNQTGITKNNTIIEQHVEQNEAIHETVINKHIIDNHKVDK